MSVQDPISSWETLLQIAREHTISAMSPVGAIFFNTIPQAGLVGAAVPLCYVIGFGVALLVADQISIMAAEFPTSGSLYTFVTQGLGVRWGFLAGWLSLISFGVSIAAVLVVMSANFQDLLLHWFGVHLDWTIWYCLFTLIVGAVCYGGIRFSLQLDLTLLMFELGVCLFLALIVFMQAGKTGQLTLVPFTLTGLPQHSNLALGIILSCLNGTARIVYVISREELFPRWLAHIHPTYCTPTKAIFGLSGSSVFVGLGLGMLWTPIQAYAFLGTVLTLAALAGYGLVSLACFQYFSTKRRARLERNSTNHFGWLRHALLPWLSMIAISGVLVGTLYPPPPAPLHLAPVVILIWLLLGIGVLRFLQIHKPEAIRRAGGLFVVDETETLS